jgi:myosin-7
LEKQISTNPFLIIKSNSFLEKLHLITSIGILRPKLRDEIYCQLCKQLTNNQDKTSFLRGWILLSLCIGCFAPSNQFLDCLFDFIRRGPASLTKYCFVRLKRTLANGSRIQPPSFLEFKAAKSFQLLVLPITFIDGSQESIYADSATTSKELIDAITRKLNLKYNFDFSINISIYDQMSSLGYGDNHVLDAISECEQYAKISKGTSEQRAPWQLFFNKDISSSYEDYLIKQLPIYGADYGESTV